MIKESYSQHLFADSSFPTARSPLSPFDLFQTEAQPSAYRASASLAAPQSLVFIDGAVSNYAALAAAAQPGVTVVILDTERDGIAQITDVLRQYRDVAAVHVVSHGSSGAIQLGSATLSNTTLGQYQAALNQWSASLSAEADVLLYGCDVASGAAGQALLQSLGAATGADVAASTDLTGSALLGGNWTLEAATGAIESGLAFTPWALQSYEGVLVTINYANFASTAGLQLNGNAAQSGNALRITPAQAGQVGSAYSTTVIPINGSTSFQTNFRFQLSGGQGSGGADGFAFVLQNSGAGVNALGAGGGGLGYSDVDQSIAIEFDTFRNGSDTGDNQVSLLSNGNAVNALTAANAPVDLNGGTPINAWIDYDGSSDRLDVFLSTSSTKPTTALLTATVDLATLSGGQVYAGFSGGTGGLWNNQDIQNWSFTSTGGGGPQPGTGTGLRGEYYNNIDFTAPVLTRTDATVNFDWGTGSPDPGIGVDTFSAVWTGQVQPLYNETYTFFTTSDDGTRLFVNNQLVVNNNFDQPPTERSGTITLQAGQKYDIRLEYYENGGGAVSRLAWSSPSQIKQIIPQSQLYSTAPPPPGTGTGTGLRGEYYDNRDFTDLKLVRTDATVNFNWGGGSPDPSIGSDTFSARWRGQVQPRFSETYTFFTRADDGVRMRVNGQLLVDRFVDQPPTEYSGTIALQAGQKYDIEIEYYEQGGGALQQLSWSSPSQAKQIIPATQLYSEFNSGTIVLAQNGITVNEGAGTANVTINRTGGSQGSALVVYTTVNDTALAGSDYTATAGSVEFRDGETSKVITVPIINDTTPEPEEKFGFSLNRVDGAALGTSRTAQITIVDNDAAVGSIAFGNANYTVNENGTQATITVQRSGNISGAASVSYATSNGTATAGSDYTARTGTLNFAANQASASFTIPITNDTVGERNETVNLTLSNPTGGNLGTQATAVLTIVDDDPGSFVKETFVSGLVQPTAFAWSPDNRLMFVAEKSGLIRVVEDGVLQATPFADLRDRVNDVRDRGMLGIAVHPDFPTTPYIYVSYTYDPPEAATGTGLAARDQKGNRPSQVARLTANASTGYKTVVDTNPAPGAEAISGLEVIVGKNSTWANTSRPDANSTDNFSIPESGRNANGYIQDYLVTDSESHSIGGISFGTDGKLYISNGDGASYGDVDERAFRTLELDSLSGKLLRVDPITGQGLTDNPFYNGNVNSNRSKVLNYGLRNPFRHAINPATGVPYIGDVGWTQWEEINRGRGVNFGWAGYEGRDGGVNAQTGGYKDRQRFINYYATNPTITAPLYAYNHNGQASAVVAGDFYDGTTFPQIYDGRLFVADVSRGTVDSLIFNTNGTVAGVQRFATLNPVQEAVVQLTVGADGNLYYADLVQGEIRRWRPTGGANATATPAINSTVTNADAAARRTSSDNDPLQFLKADDPT
jgi:glucose/arabinose dehydrogenase